MMHSAYEVFTSVTYADSRRRCRFRRATGVDATAIARVQESVRQRLLRVFVRRGLLPRDDAQTMA